MPKTEDRPVEADDLEIETAQNGHGDGQEVVLSPAKAAILASLIEAARDSIDRASALLGQDREPARLARLALSQAGELSGAEDGEHSRIIEGVFDGENMIGPDGKQYSVPANYASKSKLVEGDILKLTITAAGTFVYKQIGPIDRKRVIGVLEQTPSGNFNVASDGRKWRVLTASVTYFKGSEGDEAVILVPKAGDSNWAAVENIVKRPK